MVINQCVGDLGKLKLHVIQLESIIPSIVGAPPFVGGQRIVGIGVVVAVEKGGFALARTPVAKDGCLLCIRHSVVDFLMHGREHSLDLYFQAGVRVKTRNSTKIY